MIIMAEIVQEAGATAAAAQQGELQPAPEAIAPASPKQPPKPKAAPRKRPQKKEHRVVVVKSKRKRTVARAYLYDGTGIIRINGRSIDSIENPVERSIMLEPISVSGAARELAGKVDITINVYGGGRSSIAQAVRSTIAKGLSTFSGGDALKREYIDYDRSLIVDDYRRVEPKKFKGPKARARFQKSYR